MSVPRRGYAYSNQGGVQDFNVSDYYPYGEDNEENVGSISYTPTGLKDSDSRIDPSLIKKEVQEIKDRPKTYKALGQDIEEGSYGDILLKEYLGNRPDPLGKFLIQFGLNYMSTRPRGGKFGALTTAAEAAKKPTEQLYADVDTDRLLKLKLMSAIGKSESKVALEKEARFMVQNNPEKYPDIKTAMDALLKGRLERKETSVEDRINEEYKAIRSKSVSSGSEIRDMNKAQILQRDKNKLKDYRYLEENMFRPYTISKPLYKKTEEISAELKAGFDNIEVTTPLSEKTLMRLEKLIERMSKIKLGQNFDDYINVEDYLIGDRPSLLGPRSEGPTNVQPLLLQPQPNPQIVSKPPMPINQQTGLTATETGLLTDAEKAIRLRQQGLA